MVSAATNKSVDVTRGRLIPGTYLIENFKNLVTSDPVNTVPYHDVPPERAFFPA